MEDTITRYSIDIFQKYKTNIKPPTKSVMREFELNMNNTEQSQNASRLKSSNVLNNAEIRANLNFLINRKNISDQDEELYDLIVNKLNKITEKNFNDIVDEFTKLHYTKAKHIYRLAESIIIKAIKEPSHSNKYAKLSANLIPCYIIANDTKVQFRTILLTLCQDIFNELIYDPKYDVQIEKKQEYDRNASYDTLDLSGLTNFFGHLYKYKVLPIQIILFCFDKLYKCIERKDAKPNKFEGIKTLVESCISHIENNDDKIMMKEKLQNILNEKYYVDNRTRFIIMDAVELIKN